MQWGSVRRLGGKRVVLYMYYACAVFSFVVGETSSRIYHVRSKFVVSFYLLSSEWVSEYVTGCVRG